MNTFIQLHVDSYLQCNHSIPGIPLISRRAENAIFVHFYTLYAREAARAYCTTLTLTLTLQPSNSPTLQLSNPPTLAYIKKNNNSFFLGFVLYSVLFYYSPSTREQLVPSQPVLFAHLYVTFVHFIIAISVRHHRFWQKSKRRIKVYAAEEPVTIQLRHHILRRPCPILAVAKPEKLSHQRRPTLPKHRRYTHPIRLAHHKETNRLLHPRQILQTYRLHIWYRRIR